jgi:Bacterial regulatory protein, Fis family
LELYSSLRMPSVEVLAGQLTPSVKVTCKNGHIALSEILRVWSESPSTEAAAQTLGISRRTLYYRV